MKQNKTIISIDMSLSSTGVCVKSPKSDKLHFYCVMNRWMLNGSKKALLDDQELLNTQSMINIKSYVGYTLITREPLVKTLDSIRSEQRRIENAHHYGTALFKQISDIIHKFDIDPESLIIGIEALSYGSPSDTLTQLCQAVTVFEVSVINTFNIDYSQFVIIPGPSIKAFAGKGNFDKYQMYQSLMSQSNSDSYLIKSELFKYFVKYRLEFITEKVKIIKGKTGKNAFLNGQKEIINEVSSPVNDLVDSYWINKMIESKYI